MRAKVFFIFLCLIVISPISSVGAQALRVIDRDLQWLSPNLTVVNARTEPAHPSALRTQSYRSYFDRNGNHPPYNFLLPLKKDARLAEIKGGEILFRKTGKKAPLNRSLVPPWGKSVPPYLLSAPKSNWVLVVHPYYVYQDKENRYATEVYSAQGDLLATYDSLPTHVSAGAPHLLVSPERSGCCESLKWSIRFYRPLEGSVSEYSCPEGFCGDILFTKLGDNGPFLIVQEIVGKMDEIGASMQTNFHIVDNRGTLSASGKTLYILREPHIDKPRLESLSPYAISNLISVDPLPERDGWTIDFDANGRRRALRLGSVWTDPAPSVAFLLPKDPSSNAKRGMIEANGQPLGILPLLGIARPGRIDFEISFEDGLRENSVKEIKPDSVNILMF